MNLGLMMMVMAGSLCCLNIALAAETDTANQSETGKTLTTKQPTYLIKTNLGNITIRLQPDKAPITVENFRRYANAGHYNGTIFHRVIPDFMIQGGGFTANMVQKPTEKPIKNEASNGLKNKRGTIAMARTGVVDSATSQFFINTVDNSFLNYRGSTPAEYGYAVFGEVIDGMDVVDRIRRTPTASKAGFENVPVTPVVIEEVVEIKNP